LEDFVVQNISQDNSQLNEYNVILSQEYILAKIEFELESLSIFLSKLDKDNFSSGVKFSEKNFKCHIELRENTQEIHVGIQDLKIDFIKQTDQKTNILSFLKRKACQNLDSNYFTLKFIRNPVEIPEKFAIDFDVDVQLLST